MDNKKPNILLIFTDQQRADTIHALGNPVIKTPNLDKLVKSGVSFTNAYSPSPVCVPARCSMHYGQYPSNTGCYDNGYEMPRDKESFMHALGRAGYRTHGIGKCHFTPDPHALRGFQSREIQEEIVKEPGRDDYLKFLRQSGFSHITDPHGVRSEMYYIPQPAQMPAEYHPTQWVGDRGVQFINKESRGSQPWFLFLSFVHPHPPFAVPAPWHKLYRAPLMPLPNVPQDVESLHTYINRIQNRYKYRDQGIDNNLLRCIKAYYYAAISFIDYQVGRILEVLEKTGEMDNTLILFTSDHGEHLGDYNCFGKRSMHDTCARVPLIIKFPNQISGNQVCDEPVTLVDIAPTVLSAANAGITTHELDGMDIAELAAGSGRRKYVFSQYQREERAIYMIVRKRWKYFYSAPDDREFLFDREVDPLERRNRAGVRFLAGIKQEMKEQLIKFLRECGEEGGIEKDDWKKYPAISVPDDPDVGLLVQDNVWAEEIIPGYSEE